MNEWANKNLWSINSFIFLEKESLIVKQETMPQGTSERSCIHEKTRHVFYVSKGEATCYIDEKTIITLKENKSIRIKSMQKYFIANESKSDLEFFIISPP